MKSNKETNYKGKGGKGRPTNKKGGCRSNGKPKSSDFSADSKEIKDQANVGDINDVSYYFDNADLLNQISNFSFNEFLGVPVQLNDPKLSENVANIMTIKVNPAIQPTGNEAAAPYSGINLVAMKNFLKYCNNNAKFTNYGVEAPMLIELAMAEVIKMYTFLRRPFGCVYMFNQRNREYPRLLIEAMGINYSDFVKNVADYRIQFNTIVAQFNKLPFLAEFPIFKKAEELFSSIYIDEDSPLAQTYIFVPYSTWVLDEAYDPNGSGLVTTPVVTGVSTFAEYLDIFQSMISALTNSTSLNAVYADVLRVADQSKSRLLNLEIIPEQYSIVPVINVEIRHWLHNMVSIGSPVDKDSLVYPNGYTNSNDVCSLPDSNSIFYNPGFILTAPTSDTQLVGYIQEASKLYENMLIDFDSMQPSIEDKINATRLAVRASWINGTLGSNTIYQSNKIALGDMYVVEIKMHTQIGMTPMTLPTIIGQYADTATPSWVNAQLKRADYLSKVKYSPIVYFMDYQNREYGLSVLGDLTYYTTLDYNYMTKLRDIEMLSEFELRI